MKAKNTLEVIPFNNKTPNNTAIFFIHWGMNPKQVENATNKELGFEQNYTYEIKIYNNTSCRK